MTTKPTQKPSKKTLVVKPNDSTSVVPKTEKLKIRNGSNNKYVSQVIYGFCIDLSHNNESEPVKKYQTENEDFVWEDYEMIEDLFNDIIHRIKITIKTYDFFEYYITDFDFKDKTDFGSSPVLIIGISCNALKAHYSGIMSVFEDVSDLNEWIGFFIEDNTDFKNIKPQLVVYTNMQK